MAHWLLTLVLLTLVARPVAAQRSTVTFPAERSAAPLDGRLLVMISADTTGEPRTQVNDAATTAQAFGVDVDGWRPGTPQTVDAKAFGYPIRSLAVTGTPSSCRLTSGKGSSTRGSPATCIRVR